MRYEIWQGFDVEEELDFDDAFVVRAFPEGASSVVTQRAGWGLDDWQHMDTVEADSEEAALRQYHNRGR